MARTTTGPTARRDGHVTGGRGRRKLVGGVALLAADEGIDRATIPALMAGASPAKRATPTLTRRVKQAIAEFYVLNMLELSWAA